MRDLRAFGRLAIDHVVIHRVAIDRVAIKIQVGAGQACRACLP